MRQNIKNKKHARKTMFFKRFVLFACMLPTMAWGDILSDATDRIRAASIVCGGISAQLSDVSGVAATDTAITAVGTAAGAGGLVAGIMKSGQDKQIRELMQSMCDAGGCSAAGLAAMSDADFFASVLTPLSEMSDLIKKLQDANARSTRLGNWRTGLMAVNTTTNIASSIVAGLNKDQSDLIQHVSACNEIVRELANLRPQLQAAGINPIENPELLKINDITTWCGNISVSDVNRLEKRMSAVMGVGIGGAMVGIAGTAVSGAANSESVRTGNQQHAQNLNTAANVLAGVGTATSATGMGVNISTMTLAKKLISQAQRCEGVL